MTKSRSRSRSKKRSNSPTFYKRLQRLPKDSRVPSKRKNEDPRHHSDLFTDENPEGTVHNLRFRNKEEAEESVSKLKRMLKNKEITFAHAVQIALTMTQRSKYHYHQTQGIKEGHKVWKSYLNSIKAKK
jgi:hypothetical protein